MKNTSIEWRRFTVDNQDYLYISGNDVRMKSELRKEKVFLWNKLLPHMIKFSASNGDRLKTMCHCSTLWTCITTIALLSVIIVVLLAFIVYSKRHKVLYNQLIKGKQTSDTSTNESSIYYVGSSSDVCT